MDRGQLTAQEVRILSQVELDAERSPREVARALRMKASTVQYALRRLRERQIVNPRPFIDVTMLGKIDVGLFFSAALTARRSYDRLLRNIIASPQVSFVQTLAGDFHFVAVIHCNTLKEAHAFLCTLSEWADGAQIAKAVLPRVGYNQYRRK